MHVSIIRQGRRRNPTDWKYKDIPIPAITDRGFTGHEHLDQFNLINMNGRVYDPLIGRMLNPDITVQSPGYTQSYNRYSYCFNNPLKYTDPTGWFGENTTGGIGENPGFTPEVWKMIQACYYNTPNGQVSVTSGTDAQMMAVIWTDLNCPQGVYIINDGSYGYLLPVATVYGKGNDLLHSRYNTDKNPYMFTHAEMDRGAAIIMGSTLMLVTGMAGGAAISSELTLGKFAANFIADAGSQIFYNKGSLKDKIYKWNFVGSVLSGLLQNPFGQAFYGSALQMSIDDIKAGDPLGNTIYGNKDLSTLSIETAVGGAFNYFGGESYPGGKEIWEQPKYYIPEIVAGTILDGFQNYLGNVTIDIINQ